MSPDEMEFVDVLNEYLDLRKEWVEDFSLTEAGLRRMNDLAAELNFRCPIKTPYQD